jgi:DNA polymerase-3 subunit delta'
MNNYQGNGFFQNLSGQERVCRFLGRLAGLIPPVIVFEGGSLAQRESMASYWAATLNCPYAPKPCGRCQVCRQIAEHNHREFYFMTTRDASLHVDEIRKVRRIMREKPGSEKIRVFVISEAQDLSPAASNALLKSLEEPLPQNVFVLLTPLRYWLLDTVVSRSYVLTLSWQSQNEGSVDVIQAWKERLMGFWQTGKGLFEFTAQKESVDTYLVQEIITSCQKAFIEAQIDPGHQAFACFFDMKREPGKTLANIHIFQKALEALQAQANPSLVLDWLAIQVLHLLRQGQ